MKYMSFLFVLIMFFDAQASRLIEVEDYFANKASQFLNSRYRNTSFTIKVKAVVDEPNERGTATANQSSFILPYSKSVDKNEINFWDRKDLPLGTLISHVKSIKVKIDIDRKFDPEELNQLKSEVFEHLKLSEAYDSLDVSQRKWQNPWSLEQSENQVLLIILSVILFSLGFLIVFQSGIRKLIKGISEPLAKISEKETDSGNKMASIDTDQIDKALGLNNNTQSLLSDQATRRIVNEINKISDLFASPTPELIKTLERLGHQDPAAMGSILKEIDSQKLTAVLKWGRGDWWRTAITQPGLITEKTVTFLEEISQIYRKYELTKNYHTFDDFDLILARVKPKEFGQLLAGMSFEDASQILRKTDQKTRLSVSKYLYPGQWSALLSDDDKKGLMSAELKKKVGDQALQIAPLQTDDNIGAFFKDAELHRVLMLNDTKSERDIYRALPENSWIKSNYQPFYEIFNLDKDGFNELLSDIPIDMLATVIGHCDETEKDRILSALTNKQKFMVKNLQKSAKVQSLTEDQIISYKKFIILRAQQFKNPKNSEEFTQDDQVQAA